MDFILMGNIRDLRIKSLTNIETNDNNSSVLKKSLSNRKPLNIQKYFRQETEIEDSKYLSVIKSNYIICPECEELIDIQKTLFEEKKIKIKCKSCGTKDIDIVIELKKQNKLNLLKSAGIPSGKLLLNDNDTRMEDQIIRPTLLKRTYEKDKSTGVKKRIIKDSDKTLNISSNQKFSKEFIENFELLDENQKEFMKPVKDLTLTSGIKITNVIDLTNI